MTCMRTRLLLGLSLLAAVAARPSAQQPAAAPATAAEQPGVTFRVEVNYVEVDAAVFDRQGRFVNDLTREDFQVLEEGVPQEVSAFTLVNIPIEHAERPLYAKMPIEPDVASNAKPFEGRVYVIVLDDLQTAASRSMLVRRAARQFIEQAMAANDMAAIVYTSGRGEAGQEFTSSKRLLLASVDRFLGRKLRSTTLERLDQYQRQSSTGVPSRLESQSHQRSPRHGAWPRRACLARRAQEHQRLHRRHPRASQGHRLLERGHRLRRLRLQQPRGIDDPGFDAGGHRVSHQGEREHLCESTRAA